MKYSATKKYFFLSIACAVSVSFFSLFSHQKGSPYALLTGSSLAELEKIAVTLSHEQATLSSVIKKLTLQTPYSFVLDTTLDTSLAAVNCVDAPLSSLLVFLAQQTSRPSSWIQQNNLFLLVPQDAVQVYMQSLPPAQVVTRAHRCNDGRWTEKRRLYFEHIWHQLTPHHEEEYWWFDDAAGILLYQGLVSKIEAFNKVLENCDKPQKQIRIQARVVSMDKTVEQSLGMNLEGTYDAHQKQPLSFAGIRQAAHAGMKWAYQAFPAAGLANRILHVPFMWADPTLGASRVTAFLNAVEKEQRATTLLQPSLVTLEGQQAHILQGEVIPVPKETEEAIEGKLRNVKSADYKEVGIQLKVCPFVRGEDNRIELDLYIEHSSVTKEATTDRVYPAITMARMQNKSLLYSGQTLMIGGLGKLTSVYDEQGLPWFSRLPFVGWLFKGWYKRYEQRNLYVFITPTLV